MLGELHTQGLPLAPLALGYDLAGSYCKNLVPVHAVTVGAEDTPGTIK
jgi:hypothetical protein